MLCRRVRTMRTRRATLRAFVPSCLRRPWPVGICIDFIVSCTEMQQDYRFCMIRNFDELNLVGLEIVL
jgi:hypothetical protein